MDVGHNKNTSDDREIKIKIKEKIKMKDKGSGSPFCFTGRKCKQQLAFLKLDYESQ